MGEVKKSHLIVDHTRRSLIKASAVAAIAAVFSPTVFAHTKTSSRKILEFVNLHTDEQIKCCYWSDGIYDASALTDINYILRDHRNNEITTMDRELIDLLFTLKKNLHTNKPFHVISGYRSPESNAILHEHGNGVAKKSLHMDGRAIDIRIPGVSLRKLQETAISLNRGGVGYYAKSKFVHVDTGRPRTW